MARRTHKRSSPVAPVGPKTKKPASEIIAELKAFRAGHRLDGLSIRHMVEERRPNK